VPIRKSGDGTVPVPGWSGNYDWTGWIPFEALPHAVNPPKGVLVNANNKMVPDDYPYLITAHWQDAYRANRISQLLSETETSTVKSTEAVQQDIVSLMAREILPLLVGHAGKIPAADKPLVDALARWDGSADRMRWEPLMFALWVENTKRRLLADELGDLYREFGGTHPDVLARILNGADPRWCDDVLTPQKETCDDQVAGAWSDARAWLRQHDIADPKTAHWGDFHIATFGHLFFRNMPLISHLGELAISTSGDTYTVNRGTFASSTSPTPLRHFHGASLRAVYDLSDLSRSQFALPGGESGQIVSSHYGDLLQGWRDGQYFTAPSPGDLVDRLSLEPARP
jgi:penicillin amidase